MQLRVARHTSDLNKITAFYNEIIGLEKLGEFRDHDGYNGVFLGYKHSKWHLEFTASKDDPIHQPDEDDLLVFYPESYTAFNKLRQRFLKNSILEQPSKNPYWNKNGICILDPDNFLIVISPQKIL